MKVLVTQWCLILCDPMDCSSPGSSVRGILQARLLEWVTIPFSMRSSWPRDQTQICCIAGKFFTIWATREALLCEKCIMWICYWVNFMRIISYLMKSVTWILYSTFMLLRFIYTVVCGSGSLISLTNFIGEHNGITLCNIPWFVYLVFVWIVSRFLCLR